MEKVKNLLKFKICFFLFTISLCGCNSGVPSVIQPSASPTPSPIVLAGISLPVRYGTPFPQPSAAISPDNVADVIELARWDYGRATGSIAWSPDGRQIVIGSSNGIYFYDIQTFDLTRYIETASGVYSIAFSPDGHTLALGLYEGTVEIRDTASGRLIQSFDGQSGIIISLSFSQNGLLLASAGFLDYQIKLWDI